MWKMAMMRIAPEVVDDPECRQKELEGDGHLADEQCDDAEGERNIGGQGDRPAGGCARHIPRRFKVHQGGDDHAPDSRGGGEDRPPWVGELAGEHLAFDFEPD